MSVQRLRLPEIGQTGGSIASLLQYTNFPRHLVSILVQATYTMDYHGWNEVSKELVDNINEELGVAYPEAVNLPRPHFSVLREGLKAGLGIDIAQVESSAATRMFLDRLGAATSSDIPAVVAGAVYALEDTAVPELKFVQRMVEGLHAEKGRGMNSNLQTFFDLHINHIEVGHAERLKDKCETYVKSPAQKQAFEEGYNYVVEAMNDWWTALTTV